MLCALPLPAWTYLNSTVRTVTLWAKCGQNAIAQDLYR